MSLVGSESVIRRCWLHVRFTRERTWPVIYEYTPETDLARFAYHNWNRSSLRPAAGGLIYVPLSRVLNFPFLVSPGRPCPELLCFRPTAARALTIRAPAARAE